MTMRKRRNIRSLRRMLDGDGASSFFTGSTLDMRFNLGAYRGAAPQDLTVTRGLAAFAETVAGELVSFAINTARITDKGLLVEESRTNLCLRSQELATTWGVFNASVTSNVIAAPDGTVTADAIVENGTAAVSHGLDQSYALAATAVRTLSVYAKADTRTWIRLFMDDGSGTNFVQAWFNLSTGVVGTVSNGGTGTGATGRIQALANGWYRCILTGTPAAAGASMRTLLRLSTGDAVTSYNGDSVSRVFAWGAQLEAATNATSYIPTTTASVNRPSELVNLESTAFSSWYTSTSALSWYVEAEAPLINPGPNTWRLFNAGDTTSSLNRYLVGINSSQQIRHIVTQGGVNGVDNNDPKTFVTGRTAPVLKTAIALAANDSALVVGGADAVVDPSVTIPSPINQLHIGHGGASDQFNGYIRRIAYFPSRLTNAELQTLTIADPTLDMDFALGQYVGANVSQLTVTRASTAYAETLAGTLTSFGNNVPRITDKGLLIEESRINLMLRSQEHGNTGVWTNSNMSAVNSDDTTAPDGTLTADRLNLNNAGTTQYNRGQTVAGYTSGTVYTWSLYVKAGTIDRIQLAISVAAFSGLGYANFYLNGAGSVSQTGGTVVGSGIQALANGWYRCWLTLTCTTTASASTLFYPLLTGTETRGPTIAGNQGYFWAWGAQVEAGAFPTSYIPTTSGTITRAVDAVSLTGVNFTRWFTNNNGFSVRAEVRDAVVSGARPIAIFRDASSNERYQVATLEVVNVRAGASAPFITFGTAQANTKVATATAASLHVGVQQGSSPVTSANVNAPAVVTYVTLGRFDFGGATCLNGYIKRLAYYPYRLPNAKLQEFVV